MYHLPQNNLPITYEIALNEVEKNHPSLLYHTTNNIKRAFRFVLKKIQLLFRYINSPIRYNFNTDSQEKTLAERMLSIKVNSITDMNSNACILLGDNKKFRGHHSNIKQMFEMYPKATAVLSESRADDIKQLKETQQQSCISFKTSSNSIEKKGLYHNIKQEKEVRDIIDGLFINLTQDSNFKPNSKMQLIMEMPDFGYSNFNNSSNLKPNSIIKMYNLACQSWMIALKEIYNVEITLLPFINKEFSQEYNYNNNQTYDAFNLEYTGTDTKDRAKKLEEYVSSRIKPALQEISKQEDSFEFHPKRELSLEYIDLKTDSYTENNNASGSAEKSKSSVSDSIENEIPVETTERYLPLNHTDLKTTSYIENNNSSDNEEEFNGSIADNIESETPMETTDSLVLAAMEKLEKSSSPEKFIRRISTYLESNPHIDGITENHVNVRDNIYPNMHLTTNITFANEKDATKDSSTVQNVTLGELKHILHSKDFFKDTDKKIKEPSEINQPTIISYNSHFNLIDSLPDNDDDGDQAFIVLLFAKAQAAIINHKNIIANYNPVINETEGLHNSATSKQPILTDSQSNSFDEQTKTQRNVANKSTRILQEILDNPIEHEEDINPAEDSKNAFEDYRTPNFTNNRFIFSDMSYIESVQKSKLEVPSLINKSQFIPYNSSKNSTKEKLESTDLTNETVESQGEENKKPQVDLHLNITLNIPKEFKEALENTVYQPLADIVKHHGAKKVFLAAMVKHHGAKKAFLASTLDVG